MKVLDIIAWILLIIGGLNWGTIGLMHIDFVSMIFGADTGLTRLIFVLVGVSAIYAICRWKCKCSSSSCKM
jgi:uncharacterized membrane protein YuzA (DUF378 family)